MEKESKRASNNGVDRLSGLPDALLCHILSFLDTKYAVATCVLSTRWKNLCFAVPNIVFDDSLRRIIRCNRHVELDFSRFALRQIMLREAPYINRFRMDCDFNFRNPVIQNLLCAAMWRNVKELDICTKARKFVEVTFPNEVFASRSLVVLKLTGRFELDFPELVCLPNLKVLHLEHIRVADHDGMRRLFEGCMLLEDLLLSGGRTAEPIDVVHLSYPLLRKLVIKDIYDVSKLIIDTPKLEFFEYEGRDVEFQLVNELKCVNTVKITLRPLKDQGNLYKLLNKMHGIRSLYLSKAMHSRCYSLHVLGHLTQLELRFFQLRALAGILESAPQLQELIIPFPSHSYGSVAEAKYLSSLQNNVPMCLVEHLKNIVFKSALVHEYEFELVKFFLQNGKVLKRIKFEVLGPLGSQALLATFNRVSMFPKKSEKCEIVFGWLQY